jgi:DNA-directed RNA polymerase I, II, and III subunit RPABC2
MSKDNSKTDKPKITKTSKTKTNKTSKTKTNTTNKTKTDKTSKTDKTKTDKTDKTDKTYKTDKTSKTDKTKTDKTDKTDKTYKTYKTDKTKTDKTVTIIENNDIDEDEEEIDNIDIDADEDEFFDEKNFEDVNPHIQYHIYDPEKYENEIHKEIIVVPNNYRRTSEVITKFEYTDVTSNRAKQIENGSPIFTDIKGESDPIKMAELEIRMKRCPLSVRRMISHNICEIWDVNDMIIPY